MADPIIPSTTAKSVPVRVGSDAKLLVVEIGKKQKRKRIKGLARGEGKLFDRVGEIVDRLREEGAIDASSTPVVIVVRQKPKRNVRKFGKFGF